MSLRDLARKDQTDSAPGRFGGVERNKCVAGIHKARTVIFYDQGHSLVEHLPADADRWLEAVSGSRNIVA